MKVRIGKYPSRWIAHCEPEWLEDILQWVYDHTFNLYYDNAEQSVKVRIDPWDTWSMDHTLAYIIVPMLKQLRETKHGACFVEMEDRPEHLRCEIPKHDTDEFHFVAWDWAMDEMIWAFESKCKDDWDVQFLTKDDFDKDGYEAYQQRLSNGFRLFGKYYEGLWD